MCSSAGDIEDIANYPIEIHNINKETLNTCKKCTEKATVLLQKKDPFCQSCFFEYCNHKFRSTIGKSKKIKHGDKVLLACSSGRNSAALLHMTKQTLKSVSLRQISFEPGILFIDDSFVFNSTQKESEILSVLAEFKEANYPVMSSSLEMVYKVNQERVILYSDVTGEMTSYPHDDELRNRLKENFESLSLSSKLDLLKHLRLLLITEIAHMTGYDCVFVGDTASSLAIELLSDIALGRGSQISFDTSFYDTRFKVPVCRPLREFLNKEIALYNHLHRAKYTVLPNFLTMTPSKSCIQRLTEEFLINLQENFPATIFTVFRTGGKLSKKNVNLNSETCLVCKSDLDNKNPDICSALEALKISEKLSVGSLQQVNDKSKCEFMQYLCHGCSVCFNNMVESHYFHSLMPEKSVLRMKRAEMKNEIRDFLIEENDDS